LCPTLALHSHHIRHCVSGIKGFIEFILVKNAVYVVPVPCQSMRVWVFFLGRKLVQGSELFPKNIAWVISGHRRLREYDSLKIFQLSQIATNLMAYRWSASITATKLQEDVIKLIVAVVAAQSWKVNVYFSPFEPGSSSARSPSISYRASLSLRRLTKTVDHSVSSFVCCFPELLFLAVALNRLFPTPLLHQARQQDRSSEWRGQCPRKSAQ